MAGRCERIFREDSRIFVGTMLGFPRKPPRAERGIPIQGSEPIVPAAYGHPALNTDRYALRSKKFSTPEGGARSAAGSPPEKRARYAARSKKLRSQSAFRSAGNPDAIQ
jgi:hypothetical protein